MIRTTGALCCALAVMLYGCMRQRALQARLHCLEEYGQALQRMQQSLRFSLPSLPRLIMECAPDEQHYLFRLGHTLSQSGALPLPVVMEKTGEDPFLSAPLRHTLLQMMEGLLSPGADVQNAALSNALAAFSQETEEAKKALEQKGKLWLQLSVLGACALFILLC